MNAPAFVVVALALDAIGAVLSALLIWVYCAGNAWYASRVGRGLVIMAVCLFAILVYTPLNYFLHFPMWARLIPYVLIVGALSFKVVVFWKERALRRRAESAIKDHRIERELS